MHQIIMVSVRVVLVENSIGHLLITVKSIQLTCLSLFTPMSGKISEISIGGAQYFLTFTDYKSKYSWVYILKTKDQDMTIS